MLKQSHFQLKKNLVLPNTTENEVVPMPALVWCCEFTLLQAKEEDPVDKVFAIVLANLASISGTRKTKNGF